MNFLTSGLQPPNNLEVFWEMFCVHVYLCVCRVLVEGLHRRASCGLCLSQDGRDGERQAMHGRLNQPAWESV